MEVELIEKKKGKFVIKFRDKDKHTIPMLFTHELNKDKDVNMASYRVIHPLKDEVEIIISSNKKTVIKKAFERIYKQIKELREAWSKRE